MPEQTRMTEEELNTLEVQMEAQHWCKIHVPTFRGEYGRDLLRALIRERIVVLTPTEHRCA